MTLNLNQMERDGIIFWNEDYPTPTINCNDFFCYASAWGVEIEPHDHYFLELAIDQCDGDEGIGALLFACRKEKLRPLKEYKKKIGKHWHLFKACEPSWISKLWNKLFVGEKP